jgi:hypothetical protein
MHNAKICHFVSGLVVLTVFGACEAGILWSNGSLGELDIPSGTVVTVDTSAMTFSWLGTSLSGRAFNHNGGHVAVFDFTEISIASDVTFNVSGSKPLAVVGTGNATIASGINVSASGNTGRAGGGSGGGGSDGSWGGIWGDGGGGGYGGSGYGRNGYSGTQGGTWNTQGADSGNGISGQVGFGASSNAAGAAGTGRGHGAGLASAGGVGGDGGTGGGGSPNISLTGGDDGSVGGSGGSGQSGGNGGNALTGRLISDELLSGGSGGGGGQGGGGGSGGSGGGGGGGGGGFYRNWSPVRYYLGGHGGDGGDGGRGGQGGNGGTAGGGGGAVYIGVAGRLTLGNQVDLLATGGVGESGGGGGDGSIGLAGTTGESSGWGDGGNGGKGGNGSKGGNGGKGGGGSGGTIFLSASLLTGADQATFSAAGGGNAGAGRILIAANNGFLQPTLTHGEALGTFTGERAGNPFLLSLASTPYLPDTDGGPSVVGTVNDLAGFEGKATLDSLKATLPSAMHFPLSVATVDSPFVGFDEVFISNMTDAPLADIGLTLDGIGATTIGTLAPGESWTTLVPDGAGQGTGYVEFGLGLNATFDTTGMGADAIVGVPEPTTLSLLALGGLAMVRRKRKSDSQRKRGRA